MSDLDPARWEEVTRLFDEVVSRPESERDAFLSTATVDPELRRAVERLLAADAAPAAVLRASPATLAALGTGADAGPADEEEPAGRRIGPWRLVRELGRGGMGAVYLAERADDQYRKSVALKL